MPAASYIDGLMVGPAGPTGPPGPEVTPDAWSPDLDSAALQAAGAVSTFTWYSPFVCPTGACVTGYTIAGTSQFTLIADASPVAVTVDLGSNGPLVPNVTDGGAALQPFNVSGGRLSVQLTITTMGVTFDQINGEINLSYVTGVYLFTSAFVTSP